MDGIDGRNGLDMLIGCMDRLIGVAGRAPPAPPLSALSAKAMHLMGTNVQMAHIQVARCMSKQ